MTFVSSHDKGWQAIRLFLFLHLPSSTFVCSVWFDYNTMLTWLVWMWMWSYFVMLDGMPFTFDGMHVFHIWCVIRIYLRLRFGIAFLAYATAINVALYQHVYPEFIVNCFDIKRAASTLTQFDCTLHGKHKRLPMLSRPPPMAST